MNANAGEQVTGKNQFNQSNSRFGWNEAFWVFLYVGLMVLIVVALQRSRSYALRDFSSDEAQAQWDTWRNDVAKSTEQPGPVARRLPRSAEPPTLVLLRDHYGVVLTGALLMSSLLFFSFAFFCRAILLTNTPAPSTKNDS
jgi:hypothetical protein